MRHMTAAAGKELQATRRLINWIQIIPSTFLITAPLIEGEPAGNHNWCPYKENNKHITNSTYCTFTLVPWWETLQWNNMTYSEWISACMTGKEPTKWSFRKPHGRHHEESQNTTACSPTLLPSKWFYHSTHVKCSAHAKPPQQNQWFEMFTIQNCAQEDQRQITLLPCYI